MAISATVATPVPSATPVKSVAPTATPVATAAPTQTLVAQPSVPEALTLQQQLGQVDPLIYASFLGLLVVPFVVQLVKKFFVWLASKVKKTEVVDLGRRVNTALLALTASATSYLVNTLGNGELDKLQNPLLVLLLTAGIIFATGTAAYQIVLKKDSAPTAPELPIVTEP